MPTGRAVTYIRYGWEDLKKGVKLDPPEEAMRAYVVAEGGTVRYAVSTDGAPDLKSDLGMPLIPDFPEEFDTDLAYTYFLAGAQDVYLNVYYYRSS